MGKITTTFQQLRATDRAGLMPYLTMGYPELDSALSLAPALAAAGADLIELGMPFSDPLADGPTIQAASQQALANGMTMARCLEQVQALRQAGVTIPFVLMGYYNPILQYGIARFAEEAAKAGADGAIVPDLPPEEASALSRAFEANGLDLIFLLAPTSSQARIEAVAHQGRGFLYLVSLVGVTGAREHVAAALEGFVSRVRAVTDLPLAVGFGISTPGQAAQVAQIADGVIVGSALIQALDGVEDPRKAAYDFIAVLRAGMPAPQ
jgi:tryptophan synthase alpha chain